MKKGIYMFIVLIVVLSGFIYFFNRKITTPLVFQSPYRAQVQTEFEAMMAEENINVSDTQFWTTPVKGKTAQVELEKKATQLSKKYQLLEKKAKSLGKSLKPLNLETAEWKEVSDRYIALKQVAIDKYLESVTVEDAQKYYQANLKKYARQATIKGTLAIWKDGMIISQEALEISEENIRITTEKYAELEQLLKDITIGKEVVWLQNGRYYSFSCEQIEDKGVDPFDSIVNAVATQYADEKVEAWLTEETK